MDGIYTLATLVPAIIFLAMGVILLFFYPLTKNRLAKMTTDLAEKRKQNQ